MDSSANQLYHILNAGTFTYCLICMEDICSKFKHQSKENPVQIHLSSPNHQENVKFLFKLCVADLIDDEVRVEDYMDIMTRSVFDISHLLGKSTCYICCKNKKHLVCLLCRQEVSEMEFPSKKIKNRIVTHLQSDRHFKSVKDTNWIYHLNSSKSFFRFHKSLLYCSICKESFRFEQSNLLQFADSHLKSRHYVCYTDRVGSNLQDVPQAKGETKSSNCAEVVSVGKSDDSIDSSVELNENSANLSTKSCLPLQSRKVKYYTCHLCLGDIEVGESGVRQSIDNHSMNHHIQLFQTQGSSLFKEIICFNQRFLDHKVIVKKYPDIEKLSRCAQVFGDNCQYIQIFKNLSFCRLCSVMVMFDSDCNNLLRNFSVHFNSAEHTKVLKRKGDTGYDKAFKKKKKDLKRLQKGPKSKKVFNKSSNVRVNVKKD